MQTYKATITDANGAPLAEDVEVTIFDPTGPRAWPTGECFARLRLSGDEVTYRHRLVLKDGRSADIFFKRVGTMDDLVTFTLASEFV